MTHLIIICTAFLKSANLNNLRYRIVGKEIYIPSRLHFSDFLTRKTNSALCAGSYAVAQTNLPNRRWKKLNGKTIVGQRIRNRRRRIFTIRYAQCFINSKKIYLKNESMRGPNQYHKYINWKPIGFVTENFSVYRVTERLSVTATAQRREMHRICFRSFVRFETLFSEPRDPWMAPTATLFTISSPQVGGK